MPVERNIGLNRERLIGILHSCHMLALPSLVEGFGHVILEAMSVGLPVIATPNTGAPDVIRNGIDGFIVPLRDSQAIANKLELALQNPSELESMGVEASKRAREFSWSRFRDGIRAAYEQMVAGADSNA